MARRKEASRYVKPVVLNFNPEIFRIKPLPVKP
jgi:hypothetical protein